MLQTIAVFFCLFTLQCVVCSQILSVSVEGINHVHCHQASVQCVAIHTRLFMSLLPSIRVLTQCILYGKPWNGSSWGPLSGAVLQLPYF